MEILFNILSVVIVLEVVVCLAYVRRLSKYVDSLSWKLKEGAFICFVVGQLGGLINVYLFNSGLNWLGMFNTGTRAVGTGLLAASYIAMEDMFRDLWTKLRSRAKKPTPPSDTPLT